MNFVSNDLNDVCFSTIRKLFCNANNIAVKIFTVILNIFNKTASLPSLPSYCKLEFTIVITDDNKINGVCNKNLILL